MQNCDTCATAETCGTCMRNYFATKDAKTCEPCEVEGCLLCLDTKTSCGQCNAKLGYILEDGKCTFCGVPNCKVCGTQAGTCATCKDGFSLYSFNSKTFCFNPIDKTLASPIPNCLDYVAPVLGTLVTPLACSTCASDFKLSAPMCVPTKEISSFCPSFPGCIKCAKEIATGATNCLVCD